jgi:thymidylate kinase
MRYSPPTWTAKAEPKRWRVLNADQPVDKLQEDVRKTVMEFIGGK